MRCRFALPLLLASCGVFGPTSQQQEQIYFHQQNAQYYMDGKRHSDALDQCRRGLELDPDDYKLNLIKAYCMLTLAKDTPDPVKVKQVADQFDYVLTLRSSNELEPKAWLGYALVQQKLGQLQIVEAERLRDEIARGVANTVDRASLEARRKEHEAKGKAFVGNAERALLQLVERGDVPMLAHYHLLQIRALEKDYAAAVVHGNAYIDLNEKAQKLRRDEIDRTMTAGYETFRRTQLQDLVAEEISVRAMLGNLYHKLGQHEQALAQLNRVLSLDPARSVDYYNRGRSLQALGRGDDARRDFTRFLATTNLPPGSEQVASAYKFLKADKP